MLECFIAEGGEYRQSAVPRLPIDGNAPLRRISLEDGTALEADAFVFACGPWLGRLFPDVVGKRVAPTRQEVYYFGTPPGDARFLDPSMPVWVDYRERLIYGIPGNANRGFKVADDTPGPAFDPTDGPRDATPAGIDAARAFLKQRFPAARRRAAARLRGLPVRGVARLALHHRPSSRRRQRLDRRRRIGTRLQDGTGHRRAAGVARPRRVAARSAVRTRPAGLDAGGRLGGEMVVKVGLPTVARSAKAGRSLSVALAAAAVWTAPILLAQTAPPAQSADLKALATEFTSGRSGSGRSPGVLPTLEQAAADSAWADAFLVRLHKLQPERLTHDEWITYAMLENDASIQKDAAQFYWFDIPITPYASPLRGVTGTFGALPLRTDADLTAYLDALNRFPITLASYEARLRSQMTRGIVVSAEEFRLALPYIRGVRRAAGDEPVPAPVVTDSGRCAGAFPRTDRSGDRRCRQSGRRAARGVHRRAIPREGACRRRAVAVSGRPRLLPVPDPPLHVADADT